MRSRCPIVLIAVWMLGSCNRTPYVELPPAPIDCAQVPKPACVATMEAQFFWSAAICVPTACESGCTLELGLCRPPQEECPFGYIRDGNVCLIDDAISCYDAPQLEHCVPPP